MDEEIANTTIGISKDTKEQTEEAVAHTNPVKEKNSLQDECVYIGGLSYDVDELKLGTLLTSHEIQFKSVEVAQKNGKSRGFAFVQCLDRDNAEKCLNLQDVTLKGRNLRFGRKHGEKRKAEMGEESGVPLKKKSRDSLIVMSADVREGTYFKHLQRYLIKEKVKVKSVQIEGTKAYLKLKKKESEKLWSLEERFYGEFLQFEFDTERSKKEGWVEEKPKPSKTLFVKNISTKISNKELKELFAQSLALRRKSIKGCTTDIAFFDFETIEDATKTLEELNGKELEESKLFIEYSKPEVSKKVVNEATAQTKDATKETAASGKSEIPNAYGQKPTQFIKINFLPDSMGKDRLISLFPTTKNVKMTGEMSATGRLNRVAYIEFDSVQSALQARKNLVGRKVDGKMLDMMYSTGPPLSFKKGKIKNVVYTKKIV